MTTLLDRKITDFSDAYTNGIHIAGGERWPAAWVEPAAAFRQRLAAGQAARLDLAYGPHERQRLDLFLPQGTPRGLCVFVHGGYWMALDKSYWSHLAAGPLACGYAVALPSYPLCPDIRIAGIGRDIAAAIAFAAEQVAGPLVLTGHSAGGQLVARMICEPSPLPEPVRRRVRHVVSISGLHDLRPLMRTAMNATLRLDEVEAQAESPALLRPVESARLTAWVGGTERAEFLRQAQLLPNIWTGLGARTACAVEPDRHHFNIIDGLADPDHALTRTLLAD